MTPLIRRYDELRKKQYMYYQWEAHTSQAKTVGSFLYWRPLTVLVRPMMVLT